MIYIDELIVLNFIIDYILIDITGKILKYNTKLSRKIISCIIGQTSIIYLFFNLGNFFLFIFKIVIGIFMILVAFGYNDIKTTIKNILSFYIISFLLGGTLYYFKIENIIEYQYFLLLIPVFMNTYKHWAYNLKDIFSTKYKVTIYLNNGKILFLNGHMDTGNSLIDPITNKKVIIINKKVNEKYMFVPYKTIDNESLLKCFKPKKVYIDGLGERNDILVGVTDKKFIGFNCLLNYELIKEKK